MNRLTFIHAADLHLGSPFKGLIHLPPEILSIVQTAVYRAFDRLVETALDEKVDFVLLAGDIFDTENPSLHVHLHFKRGLVALQAAQISVFMVHGNHDPEDGRQPSVEWPDNVHLFSAQEVERIPYYRDGRLSAVIYGISYGNSQVTENLALRFKRRADDPWAIGLLHTHCPGRSGEHPYAPCSKQDLLAAGMDYWALGHLHRRQVLHRDPHIVYPGNLQGRHINEQGERGFYLVKVSPEKGVQLIFKPAAELIWEEHALDLSGATNFGDVVERLLQLRQELHQRSPVRHTFCRLLASGQTPLANDLARSEVQEELLSVWREEEEGGERVVWPISLEFKGGFYQRDELKQSETIYANLLNLVDRYRGDDKLLQEVASRELADLYQHYRAQKYLATPQLSELKEWLLEAERLIMSQGEEGKRT